MKIWMIIGFAMILLGLIVFTVIMFINHWDFSKLSTVKYVTNTHKIDEAVTSISINTNTGDIVLVPSDSNLCQVVCQEEEKVFHSVTMEDGCLKVQVQNQRKWYEYIGINIGHPKITITLPRSTYEALTVQNSTGHVDLPGDFSFRKIDIRSTTGQVKCFASATDSLKIQVSTGDIQVKNLSAGELSLQVSTGQVTLADVTCNRLTSTGNTGDINLNNVLVSKELSITRSTGDVKLTRCDAETLDIKTNTGDVTGSLLTGKVFFTQTGTGRIKVPQSTTGGQCQVSTSTGNIKFEILQDS